MSGDPLNFARSTALVLATVGVALAPTAAHAATYHHSDAPHDVVSVTDDDIGSSATPEPTRDDGDILTSAITHGPRRVTMSMHDGGLERDGERAVHYFGVATSKGKIRTFQVVASPDHWQGSLQKLTGRGKTFRCRGVHWSIGYASRSVTLSVPRRCLGRPAWVRVAMAEAKGSGARDYFDDANTTSFDADSEPKLGPRVYR